MDKYEYRAKTEQMLAYAEQKSYQKAMSIADTIDWRKVKNTAMLSTVSEIYENAGELGKARDTLFIAYDKAPSSRKVVYRLGIISLKLGHFDEAADCYEEFVKLAPKDPNQYILRYKILKAQKAPVKEQIEALEDFKHSEYVEKWAYELARLYAEAGMTSECLDECDDLILWFSEGTYVYQAMRVTGAADPTVSVKDTMEGKLPQKKLVRGAADGYSSYGNQIGLATGYVKEIYHPDYVAKRMEIGAVMGAAPRRAVQRLTSDPGDIIILLGGRTGRDGCGGATGSSKAHTTQSIDTCGAEVQKGNPPTERKIQRLFRREEVAHIIKKCNDFGAGGVSVAIGELADGLRVQLDKVPKKYAGLDGTELAISESQERMAVVIAPQDVEQFLAYAKKT